MFLSSESLNLEPFWRPDALLAETRLHFGEVVVEDGGAILWSESSTYARQRATIEWCRESEFENFKGKLRAVVESLDVKSDALELIVVTTARFLRVAEISFRLSVGDLGRMERTVDLSKNSQPAALRAAYGGAQVDAFLVLAREIGRRPDQPWRLGTWLAQAHFEINTRMTPSALQPQRLTDEIRIRLGIPSRTYRWLDLDGEEVLDEWTPEHQTSYYVDEHILDHLYGHSGTVLAKMVLRELFVDMAARIVWAGHRELKEVPKIRDFEDGDRTLLGRILRAGLGGGGKRRPDQAEMIRWFTEVRECPEIVIARIESRIDIMAAIKDAQAGWNR